MKILIVINDLGSGGAQRSLISFLQCLHREGLLEKYQIDLLVSNHSGIFCDKVPQEIHILKTDKNMIWMNCPLRNRYLRSNFSISAAIHKIKWIVERRKKIAKEEFYQGKTLWETWKKSIPIQELKYDVAISYMDGWPNYYVIEKVSAEKKVLWIHTEYQKMNYDKAYDTAYYDRCSQIITISNRCVNSFTEVFPQFKNKISILENITSADEIYTKAEMGTASEFKDRDNSLKILSVGRLTQVKAFDLAVLAAKILQKRNIDFYWIVLGDGPEHSKLERMIRVNGLADNFLLAGIKENPYPYIKECDIFVQTSQFEGKSIVLDEAKIFAKPIVVTDYDTVQDTIQHMYNGIVVRMNPQDIANGIMALIDDGALCQRLSDNLKSLCHGNENELYKYIQKMF